MMRYPLSIHTFRINLLINLALFFMMQANNDFLAQTALFQRYYTGINYLAQTIDSQAQTVPDLVSDIIHHAGAVPNQQLTAMITMTVMHNLQKTPESFDAYPAWAEQAAQQSSILVSAYCGIQPEQKKRRYFKKRYLLLLVFLIGFSWYINSSLPTLPQTQPPLVDQEKLKEQLREQLAEQLKEQLAEQLKEQLHETLREQLQEQLNQKLNDQLNEKLNEKLSAAQQEQTAVRDRLNAKVAQQDMVNNQLNQAIATLQSGVNRVKNNLPDLKNQCDTLKKQYDFLEKTIKKNQLFSEQLKTACDTSLNNCRDGFNTLAKKMQQYFTALHGILDEDDQKSVSLPNFLSACIFNAASLDNLMTAARATERVVDACSAVRHFNRSSSRTNESVNGLRFPSTPRHEPDEREYSRRRREYQEDYE